MVSAALLQSKEILPNETSLTQASEDWSPGDFKSPTAALLILSKHLDH